MGIFHDYVSLVEGTVYFHLSTFHDKFFGLSFFFLNEMSDPKDVLIPSNLIRQVFRQDIWWLYSKFIPPKWKILENQDLWVLELGSPQVWVIDF